MMATSTKLSRFISTLLRTRHVTRLPHSSSSARCISQCITKQSLPVTYSLLSQASRTSVWTHGVQRRSLWRMLNAVANRPDRERIKELGPDRACAEWLLRNGAFVRWRGTDNWSKDYNRLPSIQSGSSGRQRIEAVNAEESSVMDIGFEYFDGVKHLREIRFNQCMYLEDNALQELGRVRESLEHLEISSCGDITQTGLASLAQLTKLKTLVLRDLPEIRDKEGCARMLQSALPDCHIDYQDLHRDST